MRTALLATVSIIIGLAGAFALIWGLTWLGLFTARPMAKYAKETDRQVYVQSVTHQQGADSGIGIDCSNMRNVSLPAADRHAFAGLVIQDAAAYAGTASLSPESLTCLSEARDLQSQPLN